MTGALGGFKEKSETRSGLVELSGGGYTFIYNKFMILGIGVDIVHLPRIAALISRRGHDKLAKRILSESEMKEFRSRFPTELIEPEKQLIYLGSRYL